MAGTPEFKSCLHLVTRSASDALERCNAFRGEQDEVLFIDDAVMFVVREPEASELAGQAGHCYLEADLAARGLAEIARQLGVRTVTDREFAGLLRKHGSCLTWK